jgi:flagellar motor switch protein FliG
MEEVANNTEVTDEWKEMLQQNLIILDDYNLVAETIATTVSVISGADKKKVLSSFDKSIAATVSTALVNITGKMSPTLTKFWSL